MTTTAPPIAAAFLGAGFMTTVHSRGARSAGARLASIASRTRSSAQQAADALGIAAVYDDPDDLLRRADVDVVHVCTPNATHAELTLAAIERGRHVVCEKPLATTLADARRLHAAQREAGVVGAVPFVYRYHPMVREARARVATGETGTLLTVDAAYLQDWLLEAGDSNWRADAATGGPSRAFADIGSHLCDLVEFVTGDRIARLAARTRTVFAERDGHAVTNEDIAALLVEFDSGALGTLLISQLAPGRKNALVFELHGTAASARFEQEDPETLWLGRRGESVLLRRDAAVLSPDAARLSTVPSGHPMGYQEAFTALIGDAYAAIRGGTPDGLPTFADGVRAARLTEAVLSSAASRTWVETPLDATDKENPHG